MFEPEECWYCHLRGIGLEEHHLYRGSKRKYSSTIWLCSKCHTRATQSKWFEIYLQEIYLKQKSNNQLK